MVHRVTPDAIETQLFDRIFNFDIVPWRYLVTETQNWMQMHTKKPFSTVSELKVFNSDTDTGGTNFTAQEKQTRIKYRTSAPPWRHAKSNDHGGRGGRAVLHLPTLTFSDPTYSFVAIER